MGDKALLLGWMGEGVNSSHRALSTCRSVCISRCAYRRLSHSAAGLQLVHMLVLTLIINITHSLKIDIRI